MQISGQRTPLDLPVHRGSLSNLLSFASCVRAGIVIGQLEHDLAGVLSLAGQLMPVVHLAAAGNNNLGEIDPHFTNQVRLLVVVEDRDFDVEVVG